MDAGRDETAAAVVAVRRKTPAAPDRSREQPRPPRTTAARSVLLTGSRTMTGTETENAQEIVAVTIREIKKASGFLPGA